MTRNDPAGRRLTRIGIFYDGSYFTNINNYYTYAHPRGSRRNLGGLTTLSGSRSQTGRGCPLGTARSWTRTGSGADCPRSSSRINSWSPSGCGTRPS